MALSVVRGNNVTKIQRLLKSTDRGFLQGKRVYYETFVRGRIEGVEILSVFWNWFYAKAITIAGLTPLSLEDAQKQKEISRKEIQKLMEEKQQAISDLNSMEKSFSELFKRLEKQKEALEGYHRVR